MPTKIYVDDVPDNHIITSWLHANSDWGDAIKSCKPRQEFDNSLCFDIDDFNPVLLGEDIIDATKIYGDHGWVSSESESKDYTGFSLVYNPYHIENMNPHNSTLGTPTNSALKGEFFWKKIEKHPVLKNGYFDSYGFNKPTAASGHKSLGTLMDRCQRTRVRSRLSIINGDIRPESFYNDPNRPRPMWHKDEIIFENLRINIPIRTSPGYMFQIEKFAPTHLEVGWAYSWDTNVPHRVFSDARSDIRRIHLVLGFSPWWDYLPDENAWIQNEFYGNKHPFDMLVDGDIMSGLTFNPNKKIY